MRRFPPVVWLDSPARNRQAHACMASVPTEPALSPLPDPATGVPSPLLFWETINACPRTAALRAGLELEIFTAIARGMAGRFQNAGFRKNEILE